MIVIQVLILQLSLSLSLDGHTFQPNTLNASPKTSDQKYSVSTNADISHLLLSGIKPGSHPTIVAIPLYIRNSLSKLPSLFDILSATPLHNESKSNVLKTSDFSNVLKTESQIHNSSLSLQKYATQSSKLKFEPKEEPQRSVRPHIKREPTIDYQNNEPIDNKSQTQWSSVVGVNNRYAEPNEKMTFLRGSFQRRQPLTEQRKQWQPEYNSFGHQSNNKFNYMQNSEQNFNTNLDFEANSKKSKNNLYNKNDGKYSTQSNFDLSHHKVDSKNVPAMGSYSVDTSAEAMEPNVNSYRNVESSPEETNRKSFNGYQSSEHQNQSPKSDKTQYSSSNVMSYDGYANQNQYSEPTVNKYYSKSNNLKDSYDESYAAPSLTPSAVVDDSPQSHSSPSGWNNMPAMPLTNYNLHTSTSNGGYNSPKNTYNVYSDQSPHNYNSNPHSIGSQSGSHHSSDYLINEDIECNDENSEYTTSHSSPDFRAQTTKPEFETKSSERDNYETEGLDPTKLDLKIVHLPVSLLRRLIGSGDIGLPSFQ